jgi:DNA topoisomerase-6 subunit B
VDGYLAQTAIANPHVSIRYVIPDGEVIEYQRATEEMPERPKLIKPHPYGVELGVLIKMLKESKNRSLSAFLSGEFSRVTPRVAAEICEAAGISEKANSARIGREEADKLYAAINATKIMSPPSDCVVPIGEELVKKGLAQVFEAEFYEACTRPPAVYRGNPFRIECGIAYGICRELHPDGTPNATTNDTNTAPNKPRFIPTSFVTTTDSRPGTSRRPHQNQRGKFREIDLIDFVLCLPARVPS